MREKLLNDNDNELTDWDHSQEWLIQRDDLELKERISEGSFGVVFKGTYRNSLVAIK